VERVVTGMGETRTSGLGGRGGGGGQKSCIQNGGVFWVKRCSRQQGKKKIDGGLKTKHRTLPKRGEQTRGKLGDLEKAGGGTLVLFRLPYGILQKGKLVKRQDLTREHVERRSKSGFKTEGGKD